MESAERGLLSTTLQSNKEPERRRKKIHTLPFLIGSMDRNIVTSSVPHSTSTVTIKMTNVSSISFSSLHKIKAASCMHFFEIVRLLEFDNG